MKQIITLLLISVSLHAFTQVSLKGIITDDENNPLPGANIFIKGSYDGTTTDLDGMFSFNVPPVKDAILIISYIGFETKEIPLSEISAPDKMDISLSDISGELREVVITAGTFEASEKKRAVMMNPIDIVTTANSDGDVYSALATFPGVQKQGESGKIIVRGGDSHETKTYVDGMLVSTPYASSMPDLPVRGRFSPMIFDGVMFSTGGYSAEYGQALSSVLELNTPGIFDEDLISISLMNVGAGAGLTRRNTRSAISMEANYNNTYPYFLMAKSDLNWKKMPESLGGNLYYRRKTPKSGMLKIDCIYSQDHSILDYDNFQNGINEVDLKNHNFFGKINFNSSITKKLFYNIGYLANVNLDQTDIDSIGIKELYSGHHFRFGLKHFTAKNITLKAGAELYITDYNLTYLDPAIPFTVRLPFTDYLSSFFLESDIRLTRKLALRSGVRGEYSSHINSHYLAPRISMAYKINKSNQFSMAFGKYVQEPHQDYIKYTSDLKFETATHYLLNYQIQNKERIFRTEVYHKEYKNLVTYSNGTLSEYDNLGSGGYGYAQGIDIFWKDATTFPNLQYWLSYSFINTERKYKYYPEEVMPDFVSKHQFSGVVKYWISQLNTQACLTYNFNDGRYYNNPNSSKFMNKKTRAFHNLSANLSYLTNLFGEFTVVHLAVSNLLGLEHVYSYRYSEQPDLEGNYSSIPIKSMVQRTIILGVFISIQ